MDAYFHTLVPTHIITSVSVALVCCRAACIIEDLLLSADVCYTTPQGCPDYYMYRLSCRTMGLQAKCGLRTEFHFWLKRGWDWGPSLSWCQGSDTAGPVRVWEQATCCVPGQNHLWPCVHSSFFLICDYFTTYLLYLFNLQLYLPFIQRLCTTAHLHSLFLHTVYWLMVLFLKKICFSLEISPF